MNEAEALTLCRLAKAMCPQQALDEFTPEAWHLLLEPFRFEDAKDAMVEHCRVKPFIAPSEIIAGIKRIRSKRVEAFGPFDVPGGLGDREYHELVSGTLRRVADGDLTRAEFDAAQPALVARDMAAIEGTFRKVTAADRRTAEPEGN